ncbi:MAG: prepilin peptidase [Anaerolineae bacterium]
MLLDLIILVGAAVVAGVLVNWLSDELPALEERMRDDGEEPAALPAERRLPPSLYGLIRRAASPAYSAPKTAALWRYPLVEIVMVDIYLYAYSELSGWPHMPIVLAYLAFFALVAVIDYEHKLVLNIVMLPAFVVAILEVIFSGRIGWPTAMIGYATAQIIVMVFYLMGHVFLWIRNSVAGSKIRTVAFGFGDVTLATFCGLLIGFPSVVNMVILMILVGFVSAIIFVFGNALFGGKGIASAAIAYGPGIVIATGLILVSRSDWVWFIN